MKLIIIVLAAIVLSSAVSAVVCSYSLKTTKYSVAIKGITETARVVLISDLHSKQFGDNNKKLLELINAQRPDAIFAVGDLMNRDADEAEVQQMLDFMSRLLEIAPVYFSPGNHEMDYICDGGTDLLSRIESTGAVVLLDEYIETKIGQNDLRIGGTLGHYYRYRWTDGQKKDPPDYAMEEEIGDSALPAIVLMHMPETLVCDSARSNWSADLFVSGHTHGGVICLPGFGGLVAPTQGLFPKYDKGLFTVDGRMQLVIGSGLAGYELIPRIYNRPEICVIELTPAQ